jgi:hypothetical protein
VRRAGRASPSRSKAGPQPEPFSGSDARRSELDRPRRPYLLMSGPFVHKIIVAGCMRLAGPLPSDPHPRDTMHHHDRPTHRTTWTAAITAALLLAAVAAVLATRGDDQPAGALSPAPSSPPTTAAATTTTIDPRTEVVARLRDPEGPRSGAPGAECRPVGRHLHSRLQLPAGRAHRHPAASPRGSGLEGPGNKADRSRNRTCKRSALDNHRSSQHDVSADRERVGRARPGNSSGAQSAALRIGKTCRCWRVAVRACHASQRGWMSAEKPYEHSYADHGPGGRDIGCRASGSQVERASVRD